MGLEESERPRSLSDSAVRDEAKHLRRAARPQAPEKPEGYLLEYIEDCSGRERRMAANPSLP